MYYATMATWAGAAHTPHQNSIVKSWLLGIYDRCTTYLCSEVYVNIFVVGTQIIST